MGHNDSTSFPSGTIKEHAFDSASNGIAFTDDAGTITSVNPSFARLLGYGDARELAGKPIAPLFIEWEQSRALARGCSGSERWSGELTARRRDGSLFPALLWIDPVSDVQGTGVFCMVSLVDMTGHRRRSEEMEDFIYAVSHDLKAPLISMDGFCSILTQSAGERLDPEGVHCLERLCSNIRHMEELIDGLLRLSRAGRLTQQRKEVSLDDLMAGVRDEMQGEIEKNGIELAVASPLPRISCDPIGIRQVLINLIDNAIKFRGDQPRPRIEVGAEPISDRFWKIFVRDNGIGIDPAHHHSVFQIFQRVNESKVPGNGIGLAIVRKIVGMHGGSVWVESVKGKGSTFYFILAREEQPIVTGGV